MARGRRVSSKEMCEEDKRITFVKNGLPIIRCYCHFIVEREREERWWEI